MSALITIPMSIVYGVALGFSLGESIRIVLGRQTTRRNWEERDSW